MALSLLLAAALESVSLYSGPRPEATEVYRDWITGCDNERACMAIALQATASTNGGDHLEVMIEKPMQRHLPPSVRFGLPPMLKHVTDLRIFVDRVEVSLPRAVAGTVRIDGAQGVRLVQAMRRGRWVYLRDAGGNEVARASLAGLTAALLRIDAQQGAQDTPTALVRRGERIPFDDLPGYSVSLTRRGPTSQSPREPKTAALPDNRDQCGAAGEEAFRPRFVRLDDEHTLAIVPWACGNGAYVRYSSIVIVDEWGKVRPAEFDYDNGITGDGPDNVQAEVAWLDKERVLESATRFRAIGDCGRTDRYIWDGGKFRLSEQLVMPECRGAFDRIRVWRADVMDR